VRGCARGRPEIARFIALHNLGAMGAGRAGAVRAGGTGAKAALSCGRGASLTRLPRRGRGSGVGGAMGCGSACAGAKVARLDLALARRSQVWCNCAGMIRGKKTAGIRGGREINRAGY